MSLPPYSPATWPGLTAALAVVPFGLALAGFWDRLRGSLEPEGAGSQASPDDEAARLRAQLNRLRTVLRMLSSLSASLNLERVLDRTLDVATAVVGEEDNGRRLVAALLLFESDELAVASARGLPQADLRVRLPAAGGVLEAVLSRVEPRQVLQPASDPELRNLTAMHQCQAALCVPLAAGLDVYGVLLFGHPRRGFFTPERIELLEAVARQAMSAIENARLYRALEQEKERITEIQEEARKKLARDLHDGPTQSIGAIATRVNFARRLLERDPKAAAEELYRIEELSRRTTKEIRQMLFTLRPLVLESEGLVPALRHLAQKTLETHGQRVIVEAEDAVAADLEVGKQGVVFYIVEEAVNNARKHAKAGHIWVRLRRHQDLLFLEVEDDGVGFDVQAVEEDYERRGSLGMINLRERTELVNGLLKIDSAPGQGTRVRVVLPMTSEAAERLRQPGFTF